MATPNYGYEKRQRELEKKRKKEDKLKAKAERKQTEPGELLDDAGQALPGGSGELPSTSART